MRRLVGMAMLWVPTAFAVDVCGTVGVNVPGTWTPDMNPVTVVNTVLVPPGETLTIAPGTRIESKRRELDISAVSAGLSVRLDVGGRVTEARFAFGGMAATPARAAHAEHAVVGNPWNHPTVEAAALALADDFTPLSDHRGSAWYRMTVAQNLLRGFYEETLTEGVIRLSPGHAATVEVR